MFTHQDRIDAGVGFDWESLPVHRTSLHDVPPNSIELRFKREKSSHKGIHRFDKLRRVWLFSVNQDFLEEVVELSGLEHLYIDGITATHLAPLHRLQRLRRLVIIGGTKIQDMEWVTGLPPLEALAIENFKRVSLLDPISSLTSLTAIGIEGSMCTRMRVATLAPLSALCRLRFLFLTNLSTSDRSLRPLHPLKELEVLQSGALFPDEEFLGLSEALPKLRCQWFEMIRRHGSASNAISAAVEGFRTTHDHGPA